MIRLCVPDDLTAGAEIRLSAAQSHYLASVMRRKAGDEVLVFNGRDGEWRAILAEAGKRGVVLNVARRLRDQAAGPDVELVVALIKRAALETIVEKATELGARRVRLVTTRFTNAERTNAARLCAIATEAAEQTGRMDVPEIVEPVALERLLADWPAERRLIFCDEAGEAPPPLDALLPLREKVSAKPTDEGSAAIQQRPSSDPLRRPPSPARGEGSAILIGPEGGFSAEERAALRGLPFVVPVGLGPRILRADTAAIAALALWQAVAGDWRAP